MNIIIHYPETEEAKQELARRVAVVHAQAIMQKVKSLQCPLEQKMDLLDAVKEIVTSRESEKG